MVKKVRRKKISGIDESKNRMIKLLKKNYGEGVASLATNDSGEVKEWIPIHPVLDDLIGGGFPSGRITVVGGKSWAGKSLLLHYGMSSCIERGGYALLLNTEGAFDLKMVSNLMPMPSDKIILVPDDESGDDGSIMPSIERCFEIIKDVCNDRIKKNEQHIPFIIGWDSMTDTLMEKEYTEEVGSQSSGMGKRGQLIKQGARHARPLIQKSNTTLVICTQIIANTGVSWGAKTSMSDANALEYRSSLILEVKRGSIKTTIKNGIKKSIKANGNRLKVVKSRIMCAPQGAEKPFDISFTKGISECKKELIG